MIDCFITNHAPHLKTQKQSLSPGFTGLKDVTASSNAVNEGKPTDDIVNKCRHNPEKFLV